MNAPLFLDCVNLVFTNPKATINEINKAKGNISSRTSIASDVEHSPLLGNSLGESNNTQLGSGVVGLARVSMESAGR